MYGRGGDMHVAGERDVCVWQVKGTCGKVHRHPPLL